MLYIVLLADGTLAQAEDLRPVDLQAIAKGELAVLRVAGDSVEYAVVDSRPVDAPTNSLDEVRYDQALDGQIYEVSSWKPMKRFVNGEVRPAPGSSGVTVVDETRVRNSLKREVEADEALRREAIHEIVREEERIKLQKANER